MQKEKFSSKVIPFLKNVGYYYHKGNYYFRQNKWEKALIFFKKTVEVEPDNAMHHYNLACLLSQMGYFAQANEIFSYIVYQMDPSFTECFYFMAVNCGLMEDFEKARKYLNLYLQLSPEGEMLLDAEDLLEVLYKEVREEEKERPLKAEKRTLSPEKLKDEAASRHVYGDDKRWGRLLWQALYQENEEIAEKAIHIYGLLPEKMGEKTLREFVKNPWVNQRLRLQALLVLKNIGVKEPVTIFDEGYFREVDLLYYPLVAPRWLDKWQEVLDRTLLNMRSEEIYDERFYEDVQAIWLDYLNNIYPLEPKIKKTETWAAALEYATAKFHFLGVTQQKLARQYNVSSASISAKYKEINKVLNIEQRAYHNMLMFLAQRERD